MLVKVNRAPAGRAALSEEGPTEGVEGDAAKPPDAEGSEDASAEDAPDD